MMKSKWVNAFKNIKGKQGSNSKHGVPPILAHNHIFHENTYKKMTPCDVCSEVLRGHSRQGLRCKLCRTNVHTYCQDKVAKCNSKTKLLFRRETCATDMVDRLRKEVQDVDTLKSVPKNQTNPKSNGQSLRSLGGENIPPHIRGSNQLTGNPSARAASSGWRRRLTMQSKSISLDTPDVSSEYSRRVTMGTSSSSNDRINYSADHSPCSPTYSSRHLPCTPTGHSSPVRSQHSSNRGSRSDLFINGSSQPKSLNHYKSNFNLFVLLHNFKPRRVDDLGLSAGSTVEILDSSDSDWWRGRCSITGSVGFLPSTYLGHLRPGERVQRVNQLCSLSGMGGEVLNLVRDQIVIEMSAEKQERLDEDKVMIRTGETSHGVCGIAQARYLCSI